MNTIVIIGAGQLGSRHLQALRMVNRPLSIKVIDPSEKSLLIAKERYEATDRGFYLHEVEYLLDLSEVVGSIDLAIIATASLHRRMVIEELLNKVNVKYLVLEKLLFPFKQDLFEVESLIKSKGVKAWVNCPMRMMSCYNDIKKQIEKETFIYQVIGGEFGLATNLIHYIDWMVAISGCEDFILNLVSLDKKVINSKRKGYYELTGVITVNFTNHNVGIFVSYPENKLPIKAMITSNERRITIDEGKGVASYEDKEADYNIYQKEFKVPFQSQLTTILVEEILDSGTCLLPDYSTSARVHAKIMTPILRFLEENADGDGETFLFT